MSAEQKNLSVEIPEEELGAVGGLFGMKVESVEQAGNDISIVTTGAVYLFHGNEGRIECFQRIPVQRKVASITASIPGIKLVKKHDGAVWLSSKNFDIRINCDSVLFITSQEDAEITVRGEFKPAWQAGPNLGNVMLADPSGGFLIFPLWQKPEPGAKFNNLGSKNPKIQFGIPAKGKLLVHVYPPRPFNWDEYYNGAKGEVYVRNYCSVGHSCGMDCNKSVINKTSIKKAVANGYRPETGHSMYRDRRDKHLTSHAWILLVLADIRKGARCIYSDGLPWKGAADTMYAYETMRRFRAYPETRDCIFIAHSSWGPPISDTVINSPFIHCYADYLLRGEHNPPEGHDYHYYFAGYGISNAIACWCWWSMGNPKVVKEHFQKMLAKHIIWYDIGDYEAPFWDTLDCKALDDFYIPEYSRRYFNHIGYKYIKPVFYQYSSWECSNYRPTAFHPKLTSDGKVYTGCWRAGRDKRYGFIKGQKEYFACNLGGATLIGGIGYDTRYPTFSPHIPNAVRQKAFRICVTDNPKPDFEAEPGRKKGGWVTVVEKKDVDVACRFNFTIDPPVRGCWVRVDQIKAVYSPLPRGVLQRHEAVYGKHSPPPPYVTELAVFGRRLSRSIAGFDESDCVHILAAFAVPVIDGKLIDDAWKSSLPIYKWYDLADPAKLSPYKTVAYLTYTSKDLYVAFDCKNKAKRDSVIFLFSCDRQKISSYEITAAGKVSGPGSPECAVKSAKAGWTAEMRIPVEDINFTPEKDKAVFWVNFLRRRDGVLSSYARYRAERIDEKNLCPLNIHEPGADLERTIKKYKCRQVMF